MWTASFKILYALFPTFCQVGTSGWLLLVSEYESLDNGTMTGNSPQRQRLDKTSHVFLHTLSQLTACHNLVMVSRDTKTEAEEEQLHFQNVITTIRQYSSYTVCLCALTTHPVVFLL